jgi:dTDP-L-rhamnose 4-epimerase
MRVLVTGGAGFIGSHLVDALVRRGDEVVVFDNLTPQVHPTGRWPSYANPAARYVRGDVTDRSAFRRVLDGVAAVVHNASAVGIAQSQYEIARFTANNVGGTATLYDIIVRDKLPIEKVIVPASMSAYGEGVYRCAAHGERRPGLRRREDLSRHTRISVLSVSLW